MMEGLNQTVVILQFVDTASCFAAHGKMSAEGIKDNYALNNCLEVRIKYDPHDLVRFLRMGQREQRWDEAERVKGGGDDVESLNLGG